MCEQVYEVDSLQIGMFIVNLETELLCENLFA